MKLVFLVGCCTFMTLGSCLDFVTRDEFQDLARKVDILVSSIEEMRNEGRKTVDKRDRPELKLETTDTEFLNDTTIEERVAILEFQVADLDEDVTTLNGDVTDLGDRTLVVEGEVAVISAGQVLQDERILELEMDADDFEASIEGLLAEDVQLHVELTVVNNRVTDVNTTLTDVEDRVSDLEETLISVEETVTDLNSRMERLELSGTVAFQVDLNEYTSIPVGSVVIFDVVDLNIGDGYNSATGEFTVPTGGAGLYFFYIDFQSDVQEFVNFHVRVNGDVLCKAHVDIDTSGAGDRGSPSCGAVTLLAEGDVVHVFYHSGTDDSPVVNDANPDNTFTGFRIAPE